METNKQVHQLFKAFNALDLNNKKALYDELRDLIQKKKVQGKGSIQELLDTPDIRTICSQRLMEAIHIVIQKTEREQPEVQDENDLREEEDEFEEDEEEDEDEFEEDEDEFEEDEDEDEEDDPDYDPFEEEENKRMKQFKKQEKRMEMDTMTHMCQNIYTCVNMIQAVSDKRNGLNHITQADMAYLQPVMNELTMYKNMLEIMLKK